MKPIGHYWAAAVFSEFASASDWRTWADSRIEVRESPENWIIAMALTSTESDLVQTLTERMRAEELEAGHPIEIGNAKLGFIYWGFKLGRVCFAEFLTKAGEEADGGTGDLECETVYGILNALEERQATGKPWDDLLERADELFLPYWNIAKQQWAALGLPPPAG